MRVNAETLEHLKRWEGLRLEAYRDVGGVPTVGWGHTGLDVVVGKKISKGEAEALLRLDLKRAEDAVSSLVKVDLTDNQFGALVSFVFNVGVGAFRKSTLLKKLNAGDYAAVPAELMRWNKVGTKQVEGLTNRRAGEVALWNKDPGKSLLKSRTIAGAAASSVGAVGSAAQEAGYSLQMLSDYGDVIKVVCALLLVAGIGLTVWARVDDSRKGRL
jgi:lysozyme